MDFWVCAVMVSLMAIACFVGGLYGLFKKNRCSNDLLLGVLLFAGCSFFIYILLFVAPTGYAYRIEEQKVITANPTCEILKRLDNGEWILLNEGTNEVFKYKVKE